MCNRIRSQHVQILLQRRDTCRTGRAAPLPIAQARQSLYTCQNCTITGMSCVQVPTMPHKRGSHMSAALGDCLYVMGGWDSEAYLDHLEVYDTRAGRWRSAPPLITRRAYGSTVVLDSQIYVIGGLAGAVSLLSFLLLLHAWHPESSVYSTASLPARPHCAHHAVCIQLHRGFGRQIYVVGGLAGTMSPYSSSPQW